MPSTASLKVDYQKKLELARNIQKVKKMPLGVVSMLKDPAVKCDFETSLGPLPIEKPATASASVPSKRRPPGAEASMPNIQKIKSSYYKYIKE